MLISGKVTFKPRYPFTSLQRLPVYCCPHLRVSLPLSHLPSSPGRVAESLPVHMAPLHELEQSTPLSKSLLLSARNLMQ